MFSGHLHTGNVFHGKNSLIFDFFHRKGYSSAPDTHLTLLQRTEIITGFSGLSFLQPEPGKTVSEHFAVLYFERNTFSFILYLEQQRYVQG
jgi:hypothetical protein